MLSRLLDSVVLSHIQAFSVPVTSCSQCAWGGGGMKGETVYRMSIWRGLVVSGGEVTRRGLEAGLEGVGNCSLYLTLKWRISWKNFLGKALIEVERDFPLFSLICYDSFKLSPLKKGCLLCWYHHQSSSSMYVFSLGFLFSLFVFCPSSPPPQHTHVLCKLLPCSSVQFP